MVLKFRKEVWFKDLYLGAINTDLIHKWDCPGNTGQEEKAVETVESADVLNEDRPSHRGGREGLVGG